MNTHFHTPAVRIDTDGRYRKIDLGTDTREALQAHVDSHDLDWVNLTDRLTAWCGAIAGDAVNRVGSRVIQAFDPDQHDLTGPIVIAGDAGLNDAELAKIHRLIVAARKAGKR
ncbi:hypothetical protein [Rhodococcus pyridinivorans]|uniref:hypothetical protein n=1 Tax=Rhodococcus pyridinivorans TaxID=103816 RepID=UPI003AAE12C1